jgi:hypothetical protein
MYIRTEVDFEDLAAKGRQIRRKIQLFLICVGILLVCAICGGIFYFFVSPHMDPEMAGILAVFLTMGFSLLGISSFLEGIMDRRAAIEQRYLESLIESESRPDQLS